MHFLYQEFLRDRRALDLLYSYEACTLRRLRTWQSQVESPVAGDHEPRASEVFTRNFVNAGFLAISPGLLCSKCSENLDGGTVSRLFVQSSTWDARVHS